VTEHLHPDFAIDALEGTEATEARALLDAVHCLPEALDASSPAPSGLRAKLLLETSRAPERYAPFARSLSEMYDLPRAQVQELLTRTARPSAWRRSGLTGIQKLAVAPGPGVVGAQTYLVKFAAGVHFPAHVHRGQERVLLIAGAYTEDNGRRFETGDFHVMEPGTEHGFTIASEEDCVAATVLHGGLNFKSLPLRLFARLLGH
jgi:predicted ChrR family anti-sigma factor